MWIKLRGHTLLETFQISLLLLSLYLISGCRQSQYESTVSGTVTLDEKPIGPGVIQFVPVSRGYNPANGNIQVDGEYQLTTANELGLQPGEYDVTVAVYDQPDVPPGERAAPGSAHLCGHLKSIFLSRLLTFDLLFRREITKLIFH